MCIFLCLPSFTQHNVLEFIHDILCVSNSFHFIVESFLFIFDTYVQACTVSYIIFQAQGYRRIHFAWPHCFVLFLYCFLFCFVSPKPISIFLGNLSMTIFHGYSVRNIFISWDNNLDSIHFQLKNYVKYYNQNVTCLLVGHSTQQRTNRNQAPLHT